ncbi:MAG: bifunctional (p)ppGpp synthetase/guanosine-3',5'-bis(diphosphate) 3'-pyrophosphohydrolase [Candidatus Peribacteria bacterium]|nr:MAG: bifunctional (p)ppGpp synthetase/guanosine-3',5'-bis(diphosphate) 3'-pyrophosphohydrolase [Candidatus Peribacteria bacterium]
MAYDLRVIFIKIVDRIHNIQTLHFHPKPEKRVRIAEETMLIYVSVAKRLGLYRYQLLLENGAFMILNPEECTKIMHYLQKNFGTERTYIQRGQRKIEMLLREEKIPYHFVKGRVKSPYRIFEKVERNQSISEISQVLDIVAFRVVAHTVGDCYNVLGAIHSNYTPMVKKIKDYISIPKANGYQSLHTTVIGMFRFPVEVQIRTQKMDDIAEYGVAAHFVYSDRHAADHISESQSAWIKRLQDLVATYQTSDDKESFKEEMKLQILSKSIFLYTPK